MILREKSALICIDFINEIISEKGKLSGKGYFKFVNERGSLSKIATLVSNFRNAKKPIFHVKIAFDETYSEHNSKSILLGKAKDFGALKSGTWGTEFIEESLPIENECVVVKKRISAFVGTNLKKLLNELGIENLYFAGAATDLAVESSVRNAHDLDFMPIVVSDCCVAASLENHNNSISTMEKFAIITELENL